MCAPGSLDPKKDTKEQQQNRDKCIERMALVHYLIDVVSLDVNGPGWMLGNKGISGSYETLTS